MKPRHGCWVFGFLPTLLGGCGLFGCLLFAPHSEAAAPIEGPLIAIAFVVGSAFLVVALIIALVLLFRRNGPSAKPRKPEN
jgi:heme/copper-type cytochrome/quinol oxidase subunit 2